MQIKRKCDEDTMFNHLSGLHCAPGKLCFDPETFMSRRSLSLLFLLLIVQCRLRIALLSLCPVNSLLLLPPCCCSLLTYGNNPPHFSHCTDTVHFTIKWKPLRYCSYLSLFYTSLEQKFKETFAVVTDIYQSVLCVICHFFPHVVAFSYTLLSS